MYVKVCMLIRACFFSASVNGKCSGPVLWGQPAYLRRDHLLLDMSTAARQKENFLADCNEQASTIQSANFITAYPSPSRCTVQEALVVAHMVKKFPVQHIASGLLRTRQIQSTSLHPFSLKSIFKIISSLLRLYIPSESLRLQVFY
jgi:hypothetical protein